MLTKFDAKLYDIESRMEQQLYAKFKEEADHDQVLKERMKLFFEQYELRDAHLLKLARAKELEMQVYMGRYDKQKRLAESEAARSKLLLAQVSTFTQTETELRSQLNVYVEKFKQVEETLNNSNDLFLTFRKEMEQMTKKTKKLEKENKQLAKKAETMNKNVLEMAEERTKQQTEAETNKKRMAKLENLCRALQAERIALENKIAEMEGGLHGSGEEDGEYDEEYEDDELDDDDLDDDDDDDEDDDDTEENDQGGPQPGAASGENHVDAAAANGNEISTEAFPFDMKKLEHTLKQFAPLHTNCDETCPIHNESAAGRQKLLRALEDHRRQMKLDSVEYKKQHQKLPQAW